MLRHPGGFSSFTVREEGGRNRQTAHGPAGHVRVCGCLFKKTVKGNHAGQTNPWHQLAGAHSHYDMTSHNYFDSCVPGAQKAPALLRGEVTCPWKSLNLLQRRAPCDERDKTTCKWGTWGPWDSQEGSANANLLRTAARQSSGEVVKRV